ncbi:MFS transporter [Chloroflexota bacterium]
MKHDTSRETSIDATSDQRRRTFYGYRILAVTFLCVFLYAGCGMASFSLFSIPIQSEFGWSRGQIMVAFTILNMLTGIASPFAGGLIDRYGAKWIISTGAMIASLGFVALSLTDNIWHLYGGYTIIAIGMTAIGPVPASSIVSHWFKKRRGTAIGIMAIGIGSGMMALAPLIGGYLIPNFGWRAAYLTLSFIMLILIPLALLVIRKKPADSELFPEDTGTPATKSEVPVSTSRGTGLKIALGTAAFWLISLSFFINGFGALGAVQNQSLHLQDMGFSLGTAATALTAMGLGSAIGKFLFGWLCDQIPAKYACAISFVFLAVGTIILINLRPDTPLAIIWLYGFVLGIGAGGWLPTMSILISTNFGMSSYGVIFGTIAFLQNLGGATGPLFAGYMYDTTNTYQWAFITFLALYAIAIPAVLAIRRSKAF